MLVASLILAAVVVLVVNVVARKTGHLGIATTIAGLSIFLGLPCLVFPAVQLNGLLLLLAGIICWLTRGGPRLFLPCSLGALVISHVLIGVQVFSEVRDQQALRQQYPVQSLAERLAYEKKPPRQPQAPVPPTDKATSAPADQLLTELEDSLERHSLSTSFRDSMRNLMLQRLHEGTVEDFINSAGFGVARRIWPRREYIELPENEPIPLPSSSGTAEENEGSVSQQLSSPSPGDAFNAAPTEIMLKELHRDSVVDFVNPKGFGYVRDRQHVTGFQPHQFRAMPQLNGNGRGSRRWKIERLELVSLLTHDEPVVYVSEHLPRMDELRDVRTRRLTSFETTALAALGRGENLKTEATANHIFILGSIRALKQCTSCHSVERGALLGAFSYILRRHAP